MLFQNYGVTSLGFSFLFYFPFKKIKNKNGDSDFFKTKIFANKSESRRRVGMHMKNVGPHTGYSDVANPTQEGHTD